MRRPLPLARPLLCAASLVLAATLAAQPVTFEAVVTSAATGRAVAGAVAESGGRRAAADAGGRVRLVLPGLPATVVVRAVGYRAETVRVRAGDAGRAAGGTVRRAVRLVPEDVGLPEVEVAGDREAIGRHLIERVLARKQSLARWLGAYAAEAYTRLALTRVDANAGLVRLTEALSFVYWQRGYGAREEVGVRRRVPEGPPFRYADAEPVPDVFFADALALDGSFGPGPLAPDAFDHYTFLVGEPVVIDGRRMIEVAFRPRRAGLWSGRLRVIDSLYVLAEAELRPDRGPDGVTTFDATYTVTYTPLLDSLWLPARFERRGLVTVGGRVQSLPPVEFKQVTTLGGYRAGEAGPPDLWASGDRYYNPRGVYGGAEAFARFREARPLTDAERSAEQALRKRTLKSLLAPYGFRFGLFGLAGRLDLPVEGRDDPTR